MKARFPPSLIVLAILASAVSGPLAIGGDGVEAMPWSWTVLAYMNGDSTLEDDLIRDLNEMEMIPSSDDLNIIVQLDRIPGGDDSNGDWTDTRRFRVVHDDDPENIGSELLDGSLGELDMNDPSTLEDFLTWGFTQYPADRYMVIMEGHARGPIDGFTGDDTSKSKMGLQEFGSSFRSAVDSTIGVPVDVISFDVCWMGMVEVAYEVKDHARYMVGSFDEIPANGARYDLVIPSIINGSRPLLDSIIEVVDIYAEEYDLEGMNRWTMAGLDLSTFGEAFIPRFQELAGFLFYTAYEGSPAYRSIRSITDRTPNNENYRDAYQFFELLSGWQGVDERVKDAAENAALELDRSILRSYGGSVHSSDAMYFGLYLPGRGDFFDSRYQDLGLSKMTAWDDFVVRFTNSVDLRPERLNWTTSSLSEVELLLLSDTPENISSVRVELVIDGEGSMVDLVSDGGIFHGARTVGDASEMQYRYLATTIWGSLITFPPDGYSVVGFNGESLPPEIWHRHLSVYDPFGPAGGLNFLVRDDTGVDMSSCVLEYREEMKSGWYRILFDIMAMDKFTGWTRIRAFPTDIEPGSRFEYRINAVDVLGNSATYPRDGTWSSVYGAEDSFYLDGYHSDLGLFGSMLDLWNSSGTNLREGEGPLQVGSLQPYKCYILAAPQRPLSPEEREEILDFTYQGGELFMIVDPSDVVQAGMVKGLLDTLPISTTEEGDVNDLLLQNPSSDLAGTLPWISGSFQGSLEVSAGGKAVYYTEAPLSAMATASYGKGRVIVSVPHLLDDGVMSRQANRDLSLMVLSYLSKNLDPVIECQVDPDVTVLETGTPISFSLSGSYDPDGEIVSYSMMINDGTFSEGFEPVFTYIFDESGLYTVTLKVMDSEGGVSTFIMSIRADLPPTREMGISSTVVHASEDVVFHYKGRDPEGDDISILWDFGDGRIISGPDIVSHKYDRPGNYNMILTVTNSFGLTTVMEETIRVLNSDPLAFIDKDSIRVNRATPDYSGPSMVTLVVHEGDEVYVSGALSSDPDRGDVIRYSWNVSDGISYEYSGPWIKHVFRAAGLWSINLTVTDGHGGLGQASISVNVINDPPTGFFTYEADGRGVTFFADAVDDSWDMDGLIYLWDFGDGQRVRTGEPTIEHTYTWGGSYEVKLTIVDGDGDQGRYDGTVDVEGLSLVGFMGVCAAIIIVLGTLGASIWYYQKRRADREDLVIDRRLEKRGSASSGASVRARPFRSIRAGRGNARERDFSPPKALPDRREGLITPGTKD